MSGLKRVMFCLFILMVLVFLWLWYIIGGVMIYDCLGNNCYEFILWVYWDCNCINCVDLDNVVEIGIYWCSSLDDCNGQYQLNFYDQVSVFLLSVEEVDQLDYFCLILLNVCGEEGIYWFILELLLFDESYFIFYQCCCCNVMIVNIFGFEDLGVIFMIEFMFLV